MPAAVFTGTVNEVTGVTGTSRNSFINRLKEEFLPAWEDAVNDKVVISKLIAEKKGTMGGRRSLTSVMSQYPQSAGIALREDATLPTPRSAEYFNPAIHSRAIYSRLRWTGHVERASRGGQKVAWAAARTEELAAAKKQFEINFARMLYLGPRQVLTHASAYTDSGSPNLVTLYGRDARTSQAADFNKYGAHYLRKNMSIWAVETIDGDPVNTGEAYIASEPDLSTYTAPTLTIDTDWSSDPSGDFFIVPYGSRLSSGMGSDDADHDSDFAGPNGLLNLAVDRNVKSYVYGLARSSYPSLEAKMINNGSDGVRPFKEDYITLAVDQIGDGATSTGDDPSIVLCNKAIRREYVKEVSGDRRFPEVLKVRGFGALKQQVGDLALPFVTDRDCMPGVMWVLDVDSFGWFSEADMQMVDDGERFVTDKDAHEIVLVRSGNCATKRPQCQAMIDDIQYSTAGLTDL